MERKESCKIHDHLMHNLSLLTTLFFFALLTTLLGMFMASTFPYCATHECCASSGGWEGLVYGVNNLLNLMFILGTGYYGIKTSYYYISWIMELKKEAHE